MRAAELRKYLCISREDGLTAGTIRARLADASPGWFPEAICVDLDRKGWLEELRLCFDKRFLPKACDKARFGAGDDATPKVWRSL